MFPTRWITGYGLIGGSTTSLIQFAMKWTTASRGIRKILKIGRVVFSVSILKLQMIGLDIQSGKIIKGEIPHR